MFVCLSVKKMFGFESTIKISICQQAGYGKS